MFPPLLIETPSSPKPYMVMLQCEEFRRSKIQKSDQITIRFEIFMFFAHDYVFTSFPLSLFRVFRCKCFVSFIFQISPLLFGNLCIFFLFWIFSSLFFKILPHNKLEVAAHMTGCFNLSILYHTTYCWRQGPTTQLRSALSYTIIIEF